MLFKTFTFGLNPESPSACCFLDLFYRHVVTGSRTTSRRDFKPKGLQAEIKTLQAPQDTILSSVKRYFSEILVSLVHNKRYS